MFDITKYKWSDSLANAFDGATVKGELLQISHEGNYCNFEAITFNKDDAIAIAKHFDLLDFSSKGAAIDLNSTILIGDVSQPETTYPNLNLDSVGEIGRHD